MRALLLEGLQSMGLLLSTAQQEAFMTYIELLVKWNKLHNLTAVRDPKEMITRHILDSLSVVPYLGDDKTLCDVGTGPGLPGLILAIANPSLSVKLVDSHQKKINFVQHAILQLRLANAEAICTRVEQYHPDCSMDWILSRAFSSLSVFIQQTAHLASSKTRWLAMKGKLPEEELATIPLGYIMENCYAVSVPNLDAERHLLVLKGLNV